MLTVLNCIAYEHDLRLVGLAVVVCALATFTAISLLHHVQRSTGKSRLIWLAVSATTTGFGIWATHFIAMLAFSPGMPSGYNVALTSLSLVAAIVLTGVGFAVAVAPNLPASASIGGAIVGGRTVPSRCAICARASRRSSISAFSPITMCSPGCPIVASSTRNWTRKSRPAW
jgi:NO-binding membrane sensor protein with MHYT domain